MTRVFTATIRRLPVLLSLAALTIPGADAGGQQNPTTPVLTLAEAWAKAEAKSDKLVIAGARTEQARATALDAGSLRRPQLSAISAYDRTLRSEFDGVTGFAPETNASPDAELPKFRSAARTRTARD